MLLTTVARRQQTGPPCSQKKNCRLPARATRSFGACIALLTIATLLSACGPVDAHVRATAAKEAAETEISRLRSTATVSRARMQITLDFVGTRVKQVEEAGSFLRSSLVALGTERAFIEANLIQLQILPSPSELPGLAGAVGEAATPRARNGGSDNNAATATAEPAISVTSDNRPRLQNVLLSSGVDSNDCAIDINPLFTPVSSEIYIVARAYHIPAGANLSSSWQRQGREVALLSFETEYAIHDNCIWFYIDQSDAAFLVSAWSVEIRLEGEALMPPLPFQVVER